MSQANRYGTIVVGGSLGGCLAAARAARAGQRVLLIEPRTFLGAEATATLRAWLPPGFTCPPELMAFFGDRVTVPNGEQAFQLGACKRQLLHNVRAAGVTVLFGATPAGLVLDAAEQPIGLAIGTCSGLHAVQGDCLIDATNRQTAVRLAGVKVAPPPAGETAICAEYSLLEAGTALVGQWPVPPSLGLIDDHVTFHPAAGLKEAAILEIRLPRLADETEPAALQLAALDALQEVCHLLVETVPGFAQALLGRIALEVSLPPWTAAGALPAGLLSLPPAPWPADLTAIDVAAEAVVAQATGTSPGGQPAWLRLGDQQLAWGTLAPRALSARNALSLSWHALDLPAPDLLPLLKQTEVLVVGGGTAGAPAAVAAATEGAQTLVIDGAWALGGTGCAGGINQYYHGHREGITALVDRRVAALTEHLSPGTDTGKPFWNISVKELVLLSMLRAHDGEAWFQTSVVGPVMDGSRLVGAVVQTPDGLGVVRARVTIDATGNGDLAAAAGARYSMGDPRGGNLQTNNQCPWVWQPNRNGYNVDLAVVDNRDAIDVSRAIERGHAFGGDLDFSPLPVVRESRHIEGDYRLTLADVFLRRRHRNTIAIAATDFDQHGLQATLIARLGFLPYHDRDFRLAVPYGICLPRGLDGLLVSAKAVSASPDAFSFVRMQPDMQNLGAATGVAAALAARLRCSPREVPLVELQRRLLKLGIIQETDMPGQTHAEVTPEAALKAVAEGQTEALHLLLLQPRAAVIEPLAQLFGDSAGEPHLLAAMALAWFGDNRGVLDLIDALEDLGGEPPEAHWDEAERPFGGFRTKPDAYWQANQLIVLLGLAGDRLALPVLTALAAETTAGGPCNAHRRLHWRRIPHYDRIVCLCTALERFADPATVPALDALLTREGIAGFVATDPLTADDQYPSALLEVMVARTAARCSSQRGAARLSDYLIDVRAALAHHAEAELTAIAGQSLGDDPAAWQAWIASHTWPPKPWRDHPRC